MATAEEIAAYEAGCSAGNQPIRQQLAIELRDIREVLSLAHTLSINLSETAKEFSEAADRRYSSSALGDAVSFRLQRDALLVTIATTAIDLALMPLIRAGFTDIIASNAKREGEQLYNIPYDWHVDVPSYLTSLEPAVGALVVALVLHRAKARPWVSVCVTFALQAGPLFRLALNPFYAPSSIAVAIFSEAQFTFQSIAMALIAVATTRRVQS